MTTKFFVGQKLWYVKHEYYTSEREGYEVIVLSIGRKWVSIGDKMRFDKETMIVDGYEYSSPGRVYMSKDEYQIGVEIEKEWNNFRRLVNSQIRPPKNASLEIIAMAVKELKKIFIDL